MMAHFLKIGFVILRGVLSQEMKQGGGTGPQKRGAVLEEARVYAEAEKIAGPGTPIDPVALVRAIGELIDALIPFLNLLGVFKK